MRKPTGAAKPSTSLLPEGSLRHVAYLQKELDAIDHDIGDAINDSPAWREAEALLKSVPCIGDGDHFGLFSLNCLRTRDCQPPSELLPWLASPQSIATLV